MVDDVREIGKTLRVKFKGDKNNSFNLLTGGGRREWRAERGCLVSEGDAEFSEREGEGV